MYYIYNVRYGVGKKEYICFAYTLDGNKPHAF